MDETKVRQIVEAALLASDGPLKVADLVKLFAPGELEALTRDLKTIQEEQSEAVADLISAHETEEISDMLSGISMDGPNAELGRMREIRQKA